AQNTRSVTPQLVWATSRPSPFDPARVSYTAAEKYQIKGVFKWFEREVALEVAKNPSLAITEPVLCLGLAIRYDLPVTTGLALRQLVKCPIHDITTNLQHLYISFESLIRLRAKRVDQMNTLVFDIERSISAKDITYCAKHRTGIRGWVISAIHEISREPSWDALERGVQSSNRTVGCSCKSFSPSSEWKTKALALEMELLTLENGT
ncbi:10483_t:CDS:1, partial [Acaulospora colombiana]